MNWSRISGLAGLVFGLTLIAGFALDMALFLTTGGPPQLYAATIGPDLVRSGGSAIWPVELWAYIAAALPFVLFIPGLRASLSVRDALGAQVGAASAGIFIVLHTVHNICYLAIVGGIAPTYVPGTPQGVASEQVARALIALAEASFLPGGGIGAAFLVAALVAFGIAQRLAGSLGAARLALTSAALGALGYAGVFVGQAALPVALLGWVAFIAWSIVTAVGLLRNAVVSQQLSPMRPAPAA